MRIFLLNYNSRERYTYERLMIELACASAGTAINAACRAIATGECTSAVVGGVNIFNRPETFQDLAAGHFTSQTGACKSFDAAADGYCRGEGAAMVVLKKLTTAVRDRDNIMAVIAATGVSQNANETHITVPHGPSQMALYRKALRLSGLNAHDIDFVEAHGSGTPVGDPIEANSISTVFGGANRAEILYMECLLASTVELSSLKRKRLDVTNAFHSALTEPLLSSVGELAEQLNFRDPLIPLETCSKGHSWQTATPKLVVAHTREPVFFTQAVRRITTQFGPCTWLEAGTGSGMPAMVRRALGPAASSHHIQSLNLGSSDPLDSLARATVDLWKLGHRLQYWSFHSSQRHEYRSLNLPPYQFDKPRHWLEWKQLGQQPVESLSIGPTAPTERVLVSLTKKNANGAEFIIDSRSREWQLLVTSYVVLGMPMCPPSLYIEFVTRAAAMLQESPALEGSPALEDMVFHIPLRGDLDQNISITLESMRVPCSWKFSVDSQATHDSKATHYSSGLVSFVEADDRKVKAKFSRYQRLMSIAHTKELIGDLSAESLRGKSVHRSLSGLIQIGELYQGLKAVSAKDAEATGQIVLPPNDIMRDFVTNPVATDNFVQVASLHFNSLGDRTDNELFVNTALGRVQAAPVTNISTTESTSWIVYSNSADTGDTEFTSDIYVFNPHSSQLSMILLGAKFTKVAISSLRQMLLQGLGEQKQVAVAQENKVSAEPIEIFKPEPVRIQTVPKRTPSAGSEADTELDDLPNLDKALYELLSRVADVDTDEISNNTLILDMGMASKTSKFSRANTGSTAALSSNSDITRSESAAQSTGPTNPPETGPGSGEKLDSITIPSLKSAENVIEESQGSRAAQIWPSSCERFWTTAYPPQAELVTAYVIEALAKLGCDLRSITTDQVVPEIQHLARHNRLVNQLMNVLRDAGLVVRVKTGGKSRESSTFRIFLAYQSVPENLPNEPKLWPWVVETVSFKETGQNLLYADVNIPDQLEKTGKKRPIALLIHGGGFMLSSRKDVPPAQIKLLIEKGVIPVSVDYRRGPELNILDGAMTDVCDALRWARLELSNLQLPQSNLCLDGSQAVAVGWSTGGHLAMTLAWTAPALALKSPDAVLTFFTLHQTSKMNITTYKLNTESRLLLPDPRSRIVMHMNREVQVVPILRYGLPSIFCASTSEAALSHELPMPSAEEVAGISPLAQTQRGEYRMPTFMLHGAADGSVPIAQSK
ncbi:hypothetical protein EPUS_08465 [Endocarpon pusillum Z07020]|uniref:Uncharacterized protein n=1 Tax=Endocarpon pusillum (strain Z07020 / HMAS-L-300199) TaxID=1263415 RepID=U1GYE8_ENDPU|nr:uncharacterized protein EPUS_08465 [Endocarpon pusillum Z07020]ERF77161.1 hypothetical protein EPUS_08465 [Endocarpon pusillum Z07020]